MANKKRRFPSKEKILAAWWGKLGNPNRKDRLAEKTNGKLRLDSQTDRCWCCRALENWWLTPDNEIDQSRNTRIERCHIVPHSLGGKDNPLNFVLLCVDCHRKSPDIKDEFSLFKWMEQEADKRNDYWASFTDGLKSQFPEISKKPIEKGMIAVHHIFKIRDSDDFLNWEAKNTSVHFGVGQKASTHIAALRSYIDKFKPFLN